MTHTETMLYLRLNFTTGYFLFKSHSSHLHKSFKSVNDRRLEHNRRTPLEGEQVKISSAGGNRLEPGVAHRPINCLLDNNARRVYPLYLRTRKIGTICVKIMRFDTFQSDHNEVVRWQPFL